MNTVKAFGIIASPVRTAGTFLILMALPAAAQTSLIDLANIGGNLHFDIRYAGTNNFLHQRFYSEPRAFLQKPAADAVLRVSAKLHAQGFGILIYDAYRPWSVTKSFWDETPPALHKFVANPAKGSKHNRGCAVDLSLYSLETGAPLSMPSDYDEMTDRAFPNYKGGSEQERAHRDLLRRAMESEGFTVNQSEWWHFDFNGWQRFPILDIPFQDLHAR